jgi:hypothetical protein
MMTFQVYATHNALLLGDWGSNLKKRSLYNARITTNNTKSAGAHLLIFDLAKAHITLLNGREFMCVCVHCGEKTHVPQQRRCGHRVSAAFIFCAGDECATKKPYKRKSEERD